MQLGELQNGKLQNDRLQNGESNARLMRFAKCLCLKNTNCGTERDLKILDVRLECRRQRLMEYPDWPVSELDLIEHEAACYDDGAYLAEVLSGTVHPVRIPADSWLNSPSPYAWT